MIKKIKIAVNWWFYINFVKWRSFHDNENIYDFVVSSFVKRIDSNTISQCKTEVAKGQCATSLTRVTVIQIFCLYPLLQYYIFYIKLQISF